MKFDQETNDYRRRIKQSSAAYEADLRKNSVLFDDVEGMAHERRYLVEAAASQDA